MVKITDLRFGNKQFGTWTFEETAIGGKPLPSEAEAHRFREEVIPKLEVELSRIMGEVFHIEGY